MVPSVLPSQALCRGRRSPGYKERLAGGRGSPAWVFSSICGRFPVFLSRSVNSDVRKGDQEFLRRRYQCCQGLLTHSLSQKPGPPSRDADKGQRPDVISGVGGDGETKAECGPKFGLWLERERAGTQFPGKPGPRAGTQGPLAAAASRGWRQRSGPLPVTWGPGATSKKWPGPCPAHSGEAGGAH